MSATYSSSYIDSLFARHDAVALHTVISVLTRDRRLPDECALFARVLEWLGCDWQYYEALEEGDFREICGLLEKFGMEDVLAMFVGGRDLPEDSNTLRLWFDSHELQVRERIFHHLSKVCDALKG